MLVREFKSELERYSTYRADKVKDYICPQNGFHKYDIKGEDEKLLVDVCVCCGHEMRFPKTAQGRIDNILYGESHILYFLQTTHPLFKQFYPGDRPALPDKVAIRKKAVEEMKEEFRRAAFENW